MCLEEGVFTRLMTTMGEKLSADEVNLETRNSRQSQIWFFLHLFHMQENSNWRVGGCMKVKEMMSAAVDTDGKIHYEDFAELLGEE